jgi:serine protease Do
MKIKRLGLNKLAFFSLASSLILMPFTASFATSIISSTANASIAPMLKKATPDVVNITVEEKTPGYILKQLPPNLPKSALPRNIAIGSGVIFDAHKGLIVTNAHVIKDQKMIVVTLKDGRRYRGKLIAKDTGFDLAVIHINAKNLHSMPFSNSDNLQVGDFVAAIGSPFGLTQTVTSGVVSALDRDRPKIEGFQSFIQTDAPINPGNSGGALVNMKGQLVGINTAILSRVDSNIGIGFSIPSNMVKSVITQLLKYGKVERGMMGVLAQNITPDLQDALGINTDKGALVTETVPGSPAQKAGFLPEDVILSVNGEHTQSADQLRNDLGLMRPGTKIHVVLLRNHKKMALNATVGDPKKLLSPNKTPFIGGVTLRDFNEIESDGSNLRGVLIANVADASNAALDGLQPGDVITSVDNTLVHSAKTLKGMLDDTKKENVLISFKRNNNTLYAVLSR